MRPGHRGNAERLRAKIGAPGRITPEHIRQADRNLTRRSSPPRLVLWLVMIREFALGIAFAALGNVTAYGIQHHVTSLWAFGGSGALALLAFYFLRVVLERR